MSGRLNMAQPTTDSRTPRRSPSARSPYCSSTDRRRGPLARRLFSARGTALMETALTLPLLLLVSVGIFEFGRAYQTWQILTNAAREGARVAAVTAGGGLALGTYNYMHKAQARTVSMPTRPVVVAAANLDIGADLTRDDLKTIDWPANAVPAGAFGTIDEVAGRGLIAPVIQNE